MTGSLYTITQNSNEITELDSSNSLGPFGPSLVWHSGGKVIETQTFLGEQFRKQKNLSCMHREVFGDVEDGFEDVDVVALDFPGF